MNQIQKPKYFDIFRALHRGALSLWLNRQTLGAMTLVPTIVTFLTLMAIRTFMSSQGAEAVEDADTEKTITQISPFVLSLMQIPADFVTGIFCSLIIFIIMNAPSKKDKDAPVMFTLNIMERKDLLLAGAIAHVIFGYFAGGLLGVMQMIFEPLQAAADAQETDNIGAIVIILVITGLMFYGIRFAMLPILIIAQANIKDFYIDHKQIGFSLPIFAIKFLTTAAVGTMILIIGGGISSLFQGQETTQTIAMAVMDLSTAFGSVVSAAWTYAALAIGYRYMIEGDGKK